MCALFFRQKWQNSDVLALNLLYYIVLFVGQMWQNSARFRNLFLLLYPPFCWTKVGLSELPYYMVLFLDKSNKTPLFWHLFTLLYPPFCWIKVTKLRTFLALMYTTISFFVWTKSDYLNYITISLFFLEKVTKIH